MTISGLEKDHFPGLFQAAGTLSEYPNLPRLVPDNQFYHAGCLVVGGQPHFNTESCTKTIFTD